MHPDPKTFDVFHLVLDVYDLMMIFIYIILQYHNRVTPNVIIIY